MHWHNQPREIIEKELNTNIALGLTDGEVSLRLEKYGKNQLDEKKPKSFLQRFMAQLSDFMVIILIIAAVVSFGMQFLEEPAHREFLDSIIILAVVLLNAVLGVVQESKAEQSLAALKKMSSPNARVIRNGIPSIIASTEIVPGDICLLEAGDFIPADGRLIDSASLKVEESALTGESVPVTKEFSLELPDDTPLAERKNMVYSSCAVSYGRGTFIVTETGMKTATGKIASLLQNEEEQATPLQIRLAWLGKRLGILALIICFIVFALGIFQGKKFLEMFMTSVALAVAAIPEGLPAIVTIVLALGVSRMVEKHSIIRKLPAVETLGSASVICSDKTGTLTQNRMTLVKLFTDSVKDIVKDDAGANKLIKHAALCCDAKIETNEKNETVNIGDPTEIAIVAAASVYGYTKQSLEKDYPRQGEIPFDSDRKMMTTIHEIDGQLTAVVKGAPDILFDRCIEGDIAGARRANEKMAADAIRVLGVAVKKLSAIPGELNPDEIEKDLIFIGLVGMIDPPRPEAAEAVKLCDQAGIITVMITGDNVLTAAAIAKELGIMKENTLSATGRDVAAMNDDQLFENIQKYRVFARVTPEDKIRIVKAWQRTGAVVSMTGDGVNDAPALKAADIGCAMGITGTDVAKGAADMVLTDDNFATIVTAVKEGRGIYTNIQRSIQFLLGSNLAEIFTVFFCMLFGFGSPLLALHILWINLVTDSLPALALGVEPINDNIMNEKPRPKSEGLFTKRRALTIIFHGCLLGFLTILSFYLGASGIISPDYNSVKEVGSKLPYMEIGRTMAFFTLATTQLFHAFNNRSEISLFKVGVFKNKWMIGAFFASFALMLLTTIHPLNKAFGVVDLTLTHYLVALGLAFSPIVVVEIQKLIERLVLKNKA